MTTRLRVRQHSMKDEPIFEVWDGHQFVAGIYAMQGRGIRVISKYPTTIERDDDERDARETAIRFAEREEDDG
jgi:hypothetical protein